MSLFLVEERFMKFVSKTENCWNWTGGCNKAGYGQYNFDGKTLKAHRFSFTLCKGKIPEGLCILHSCDNRRCVNPAHLRTGTHLENMNDRNMKNRQTKGESHGRSILKELEVREILDLFACGFTANELANQFEVSIGVIGHIINNRTWKHIPR